MTPFKKFTTAEAGEVLNRLYDSEINFLISNFWDSGFDFEVGDKINGYEKLSDETVEILRAQNLDFNKIQDVVSALAYSITESYPESEFTTWYKSLNHAIL